MPSIRLVLVDDHTLFRAGLRVLLERSGEMQVVAEAEDGFEALAVIANDPPDIVLMDLMMPRFNGLEATSQITKSYPSVRVIVLSMNSAEELVLPALNAGASGFLQKNCPPEELLQAVKAVSSGETHLSNAATRHLLADYRQRVRGFGTPLDALTPRQRQVLQLIAEGNSTKQIAALLNVTFKTAETYRSQLMDAVGLHDIAGLTRFAIRHGLVSSIQ